MLANQLGVALKARDFSLILAESCTGGMVAQMVTSIAGSSAWFDRGYITYSNQAKTEMLGVSPQTLESFGAVSEETAAEMVLGCLKISSLNRPNNFIAASITGIAGPDGGTLEKPVGTVCFAWADTNYPVTTITKQFDGNRQEIRQQATTFLLGRLAGYLTI
jgi:nicotinamide-nucleotide amidase